MLSVFSHRFHRFTQKLGCLQGGALVPSVGGTLLLRRQGYLRYYLPHPTNLCKSVQSVGGLLLAECILPQISQIYTEVRLSSRRCTCAICGRHFAVAEARIPPLLSSAPNESVLICAICGRLSPAAGSVDSVQSVGGLLLARLVHLRQVHPLKMHLCNLWEALLSSRFCVNL